jgi:dCMP deaminase
MLTNYISKCCNAHLNVNIKGPNTVQFFCQTCGKPCDIIKKEKIKMVSNCCNASLIISKFKPIICSKCEEPCNIKEIIIMPDLISACCGAKVLTDTKLFMKVCSRCGQLCDVESILNTEIPLYTRPSWDEYFLSITKLIASRSTCLRRQIGCVIVKENRILTTGYNGMPSGFVHCADRGGCMREKENVPSGERLDYCFACHAESNAICQAAKFGISLCGATVYLTNLPCTTCSKLIIQCKIKKVIYIDDYPSALTLQLFKESKTELIKYEGKLP